ncbi:MAG: UDP-N-acetylmuramoyl-L-alanine--D-glutamate ligase [Pseudohongiellaceae bacterium]
MRSEEKTQEAATLIVGLGRTGLSCARYFRSRGRPFRIMDSRFSPPALAEFRRAFPDVEPVLGGFSRKEILSAGEIVLSPGISLATPEIAEAVQLGIPVIGDIDIFSRAVSEPVAAVTGSNGKSTVVTLLGEMAREAGLKVGVGGNLDGRASMPALDLLRTGVHDLYVLELSSFQLETTQQLNARAAVVLNVSEDHLDRYESMQQYRAAKLRIFNGCQYRVVNLDDPLAQPDTLPDDRVLRYGLSAPERDGDFGVVSHEGQRWLVQGRRRLVAVSELRLVGEHNLSNVLAALAMGTAVGLSEPSMVEAVRQFRGLPHRCQWVGEYKGVAWFNDSKGTNVAAAMNAISSVANSIPGQVILIAGGVSKGADFRIMVPVLRGHVGTVVLIGQDAGQLEEAFSDVADIQRAASLDEAVSMAAAIASPGDAVLLSPACASFDMFQDFAHRGRVFTAAVEALQ